MAKTYQNDNSFFTVVVPQMCTYYAWPFYKWLNRKEQARFRMIQDTEIEAGRFGIQEVDDIYPGIKVVGIVMNPYARIIYKFNKILEDDQNTLSVTDRVIRNTFESRKVDPLFKKTVLELDETGYTSLVAPSAALLPQLHWLSYTGSNGYRQADYIIRGEHASEDIKPITDYFCLDNVDSFDLEIPEIEYRSFYTDEIKDLVSKLYEIDIKTFGYKF